MAELLEQEDEDGEELLGADEAEPESDDVDESGIRADANLQGRGVGRITRETTGVTLRALLEESEEGAVPAEANVLDTDYELSRAPLDRQLSSLNDEGQPSDEPTVVSKIQELTEVGSGQGGLELNIGAPLKPASGVDGEADGGDGDADGGDAAQLSDGEAAVDEQTVSEGFTVDEAAFVWRVNAALWETDSEPTVIFQWHEHEAGTVFGLLLSNKGSGGPDGSGALFRAFMPEDANDEAALRLLSEVFDIRIEYVSDGAIIGSHAFALPLEENVCQAIERAQAGRTSLAAEALGRSTFEPLAGIQHSFSEGQFGQLMTAAETQVAAGIVSYWSQPAMTDRLVFRLGFPLVWWREIQRRVGEATIQFGLATGGEFRSSIQSTMAIEDESKFVKTLLSHFSEVNLNLRPSELGPIALWENWDALLAWSDELGISVDAQVEELAAQALRNAGAVCGR